MIPFQERKKFRQIFYSKTTIFVFFVLIVLIARGAWGINEKASIARAERDEASRALLELQNRTTQLQTSVVRLRSNRGIEEELRQKFSVGKKGEEVVVVVDEKGKKSENGEASERGMWARILSVFWGE